MLVIYQTSCWSVGIIFCSIFNNYLLPLCPTQHSYGDIGRFPNSPNPILGYAWLATSMDDGQEPRTRDRLDDDSWMEVLCNVLVWINAMFWFGMYGYLMQMFGDGRARFLQTRWMLIPNRLHDAYMINATLFRLSVCINMFAMLNWLHVCKL